MRRGREANSAQNVKQQQKSYVVEDFTKEDLSDEDLDNKINEFESGSSTEYSESYRPNQNKMNKSLENLIFMGRHSKEIELAGHKFEISTLTHRENNDVMGELVNFGDAADLFTIRVLTLAHALKKIDGICLNDIDINEDFSSNYHKRMTIVDNLQLALVEKLYKSYEELVKESNDIIEGETVKN